MKTALEKPNQYATAALTAKRNALLGEITSLEAQVKWRRVQLEHVQATLHVFGLGDAPAKPIKAYKRIALFKQGQLCKLIRDTLRDAGGKALSTAEIVTEAEKRLGVDPEAHHAFPKRIRASLAYLHQQRREVLKEGHYTKVRWRLR